MANDPFLDDPDRFGNPYHGLITNGTLAHPDGDITGLHAFSAYQIFNQELPGSQPDYVLPDHPNLEFRKKLTTFTSNGYLYVYGKYQIDASWIAVDDDGNRITIKYDRPLGSQDLEFTCKGPAFVMSNDTSNIPAMQTVVLTAPNVNPMPAGFDMSEIDTYFDPSLYDVSADGKKAGFVRFATFVGDDYSIGIGMYEAVLSGSITAGTLNITMTMLMDFNGASIVTITDNPTTPENITHTITDSSTGDPSQTTDGSCPPGDVENLTEDHSDISEGEEFSRSFTRSYDILIACWYDGESLSPVRMQWTALKSADRTVITKHEITTHRAYTEPLSCEVLPQVTCWKGEYLSTYIEKFEYDDVASLNMTLKVNGVALVTVTANFDANYKYDYSSQIHGDANSGACPNPSNYLSKTGTYTNTYNISITSSLGDLISPISQTVTESIDVPPEVTIDTYAPAWGNSIGDMWGIYDWCGFSRPGDTYGTISPYETFNVSQDGQASITRIYTRPLERNNKVFKGEVYTQQGGVVDVAYATPLCATSAGTITITGSGANTAFDQFAGIVLESDDNVAYI